MKARVVQDQEAPPRSVGFRLGDQARFPNSCLAGNQNKLPLSALGSVDVLLEGGQIRAAVNEPRAQDQAVRWNLLDQYLSSSVLDAGHSGRWTELVLAIMGIQCK